jgi:hypothetical protein
LYNIDEFLELLEVLRYMRRIAREDPESREGTLKILFDFFEIPWHKDIVEVVTSHLEFSDPEKDWMVGYGYAIAFDCYREEMKKWPLRSCVTFEQKCKQFLEVVDGWVRLPVDIRERLTKRDKPF